jgi:hypothetical protein
VSKGLSEERGKKRNPPQSYFNKGESTEVPLCQKGDFAAKKTLSHKADRCNLLDMLQTIKDLRAIGIVDSDSGGGTRQTQN